MVRFIRLLLNEKGRFLWSAHRITERQKAGKARSIKGKQLKNSRSTASRPPVARLSSPSANLLKIPETQRFMFIGTQCDLWADRTVQGTKKVSRGNFPRLIFSLIPSLFERHISIGCADLIWDITLDEISALCLFIGRGPFFA